MADYDFVVDGIYYRMVSLENHTCVVSHPATVTMHTDVVDKPLPFKFCSKLDRDDVRISSYVRDLTTNDVFGKPNNRGYDYYKGNVVIPEKVEYKGRVLSVIGIDSRSFRFCKHLLSVYIPSSVKDIGDYAFYGCVSLARIDGSLNASIGRYAFAGCIALSKLEFKGGAYISAGAFMYCTSLSGISIPDSISEIGEGAFMDCPKMKYFRLEDGTLKLSVYGRICGRYEYDKTGYVNTFYLGRNVFYYPYSSRYSSLIGDHPFGDIEELVIGDNLLSLSRDAFWMGEYERDKVETEFKNPFDLPSLKKLVMGKSLRRLLPFSEARLEKITARGNQPPFVEGELTMYAIINAPLWVPEAAVERFQNATIWKDFVIMGY